MLTVLAMALMLFEAPRELTLIVFALIVMVAATLEAQRPIVGKLSSLMRHLGDLSFGLYMLHSFVGLITFKAVVPKVQLLKEMPILAAMLALLVTLGLAVVSFRCLEMPARRWMSNSRVWQVPVQNGEGQKT